MARLKMAALVLVALAACTSTAQAASSVWTSGGKTLVLSTADWTLFAPIRDAQGDGKGVFINGTKIFTFPASKNKNKPAVKSDGTTKAATLKFNVLLTPATVTAGQLQEGTTPSGRDKISLRISFKLPKGGKFEAMTNLLFQTQSTAFPYASLYAGASQAVPKELTGASAFKLGKPSIKDGRNKKVPLSTSGATFRLAQESAVSVLCKNGYGGTFVTGANGTASGCAVCAAGKYGSQLDQQTACKSCRDVGGISSPGAAVCTNCTAGQAPNADATACVPSGNTSVVITYPALLLVAPAPCNTTTSNTIKANQEAFLKTQPGVQGATVAVTCSIQARRHLLATGDANYAPVPTLTCATKAECDAAYAKLAQAKADCCPKDPAKCSAAEEALVPPNCKEGGVVPPPVCPDGTYQDPTTKACNPCPNGCTTCTDAYTCVTCKAGNQKETQQLDIGYNAASAFLWSAPAVGRWPNAATKTCDTCMDNCLECTSGTDCSKCMSGYFVNQNLACTKCNDSNCDTCSSSSVCTKCVAGYRLQGSVCVPCNDPLCAVCSSNGVTCTTCLAGHGPVGAGGSCAPCGAIGVDGGSCGWGSCTPTTAQCTSCLPTEFPNDPFYQTQGFILTGSKTCAQCTNLGNLGQGSNANLCSKCSSNPDLCDQGGCADGFYLGSDLSCRACVANCKVCANGATCQTCKKGYFRDSITGTCVQCAGNAALNCESCAEQNKCNACATGYFLDKTTKACVLCTTTLPNAAECSNETTATRCSDEFFLSGGLCVACGSGCKTCKNDNGKAGECLECTVPGATPDPGNNRIC